MKHIKTFSSFRNSAFRLYYIGMVGQWSSMNMQIVARSLLIYRISDSGIVLGIASLANAIPVILISLYGGAFADRVQKKVILFYSMVASLLVSLGVAFSITTGYLSEDIPDSWWVLVITAVIQGTIMGLMMPSRQAIISEIVDKDQVLNAVSLNMMGMNVFRILAPAATGFLIEAFDFSIVYFISAGMYALAAFCMFLMPKTAQVLSHGKSALSDIIEGFRYIRREKTMLLVIVSTLFVMICGMPFMQLMPMITEDVLDVGASGMGIMLSVSGVGAITGSLILASIPNRKRGIIMITSGIIMGIALTIFAASYWWMLSIFVVWFIGLGQTTHRASGNSLAQNYTPPEYRGRVMSFMMMGLGFSSLGTFFAGILAESVGIQWAMGGFAVMLVIASIGLIVLTPRLRRLD
ncbi:MAG: MFS transporter [Dehalococcoidia bacterium]